MIFFFIFTHSLSYKLEKKLYELNRSFEGEENDHSKRSLNPSQFFIEGEN